MTVQRFNPVASAAISLSEQGEYVKYEDYAALADRLAETNLRNTELVAKIEPMDRRIAELERRLSQQQSIAYHNLDLFNRADKQCRLVEKMLAERDAENEGLMLTVGRLRVEKESAEKRIADLDGHKRLIGWRASDYTDETSDPELAKNWAAAIGVLPIFEGDVNTKLSAAGIGKGE